MFPNFFYSDSLPIETVAAISRWFFIVAGTLGAIGAVAVFVFGVEVKCPLCNQRCNLISGGSSTTLVLDCPHCGEVRGNVLWDSKFRIAEPDDPVPSEQEK